MSTHKIHIQSQKKKERIYKPIILICIAIVVILAAWYLQQQTFSNNYITDGEDNNETPNNDQKHPGTLAPSFSLISLNGDTFHLSDFKGKIVIIDFMATWCVPCRLQMPTYNFLWEKYEDNVVLISIDIDPTESEDILREFVKEFPYATWIWAMDTVNLAAAYQIVAIPKTVIIDQDSYIRFTYTGVADASIFTQEIDRLID